MGTHHAPSQEKALAENSPPDGFTLMGFHEAPLEQGDYQVNPRQQLRGRLPFSFQVGKPRVEFLQVSRIVFHALAYYRRYAGESGGSRVIF
jgi:hypothetical protein